LRKRRHQVAAGEEMIETLTSSTGVESITIEAAARLWLDNLRTRKRGPAKVSSLAVFSSYLNVHIVPAVGSVKVEDFGNRQMKDFVSHLASKGLGPKSIQEVSGAVKQIISSLVDPDTGNRIHARSWNSAFVDMPFVKAQRQPTVTAKEIENGIGAAFHSEHKLDGALWALAAGSGARIGELRSLRIGPIETSSFWNPEEASLTIRTSVWRNIEHAPKTDAGHRTIEIAESLNDLLKDFVLSRSASLGDFLFANTNGKPTDVSTLQKHLDANFMPGKGFHSLRRFRTTVLRGAGCKEEILRYWLGHASDGSITDLYSKLSSDVTVRRAEANRCGLGFQLPSNRT
jgi:integrase